MNLKPIRAMSSWMLSRVHDFVTKTPQRKWTAVGTSLGFGLALIAVPPLGIAAFGGAIGGWWIVVCVVTLFGAVIGNRAGVEVERRRDQRS